MLSLASTLKTLRKHGLRRSARRGWARVNKLDVVQFGIRGAILPYRIQHVFGPMSVRYALDELIVISVVWNGLLYANAFLDHYRGLGAKHFIFLDNGSTDGTVELLSRSGKDITVLSTRAPYRHYENTMKRYLATQFSAERWCLCADIDELLDYPFSAARSLQDLLGYLNFHDYNAVITQMLDMFSDVPLPACESLPGLSLKSTYRYYDISAVQRSPYFFPVPDARIQMHHGGIRKSLFGTNNGLTKISLFRMDGRIEPFVGWHHARNARIADITCVLLHFPFVSSFSEKVREAAITGRYGYVTTDEYEAYARTLSRSPAMSISTDTASILNSVDELVANGFLVVSQGYENWMRTHAGVDTRETTQINPRCPRAPGIAKI